MSALHLHKLHRLPLFVKTSRSANSLKGDCIFIKTSTAAFCQNKPCTPLLKQVLHLSKAQRLRTPADYRRVYQSKQWGGSAYYSFNVYPLAASGMGVKCADYSQPANSLIGVTVSKKVSKSAVVRNRIKRQVKEFYRLHQYDISDAELVITAKPACAKAQDAARQKSLLELWSKVLKWQRWRRRTEASSET